MSRAPGGRARRQELLQRVLADLSREFGGTLPREVIAGAARRAVEGFEGARVDDFVPILAWRRARRDLLALSRASAYARRDGTRDGR
ncbi:MAG: three-helix bundle dimerization domain-containing protein [Planctomycetaceae bacterium]